MIPTILLDTVTKKNPNTIIKIPTRNLLMIESPGICGKIPSNTTNIKLPINTVLKERSFSVRMAGPSDFSFIEPILSLKDEMIVGIVFIRVINPPAATAPAPICRIYARYTAYAVLVIVCVTGSQPNLALA